MTNEARFTTGAIDGISVIAVFGEVDLSNVGELKHCLETAAEARAQGIVVDLTKAEYFDSRTIALLADFAQNARTRRQRVALVAPSGGFAPRILDIAGLPRVIPTFETTDEAVASVKSPATA